VKPGPQDSPLGRLAPVVLGLLLCGCGLEPGSRLLPNQPPEVALDRPAGRPSGEQGQRFALSWKGRDPDGMVDHYVFALDPPAVDRVDPTWSRTQEAATTVGFPRGTPMGRLVVAGAGDAEDPHVFAVRAVDDAGAMSAPATMAFFGANIAPEVAIVDPRPNAVFTRITGTSLEIRWTGRDLDGQITKYKYRLFGVLNPDFPAIPDFISFVRGDPDSLRRLYAPDFASWDSVGPDVQSVRYTGLTPNTIYLFAITAFDDAGDYDPVFSLNKNLLRFAVTNDSRVFPLICVSSPLFNFCHVSGGDADPHYELPAEAAIPVTWFAYPVPGSTIQDYRWVLDPLDPADEKKRSHPTADPNHWTPWSLGTTSAEIGPFRSQEDGRTEHVLYVQARDIFDRVSTLRIHFALARATHERDLLVVDDTRLTPDQVRQGSLDPPRGAWPSAAELDTFLYARGGYPWQGYPAGTLSRPGLLAGYDFDTLGTRGLPDGIVPLSLLSRYRQVIWMTDDLGSQYPGSPADLLTPIMSLRLMSGPGYMSTLSAYVAQGGKLWLGGGGAGFATLAAWQKRNTIPDEFTKFDGELVPGRFMYDFAHWRSALTTKPAVYGLLNSKHILSLVGLTFPPYNSAAPGRGWMGHGPDHDLNMPNYGKLENVAAGGVLTPRTCATDPPSPLRGCNSLYLLSTFTAEFMGTHASAGSNFIIEDVDPRPNHERLESTLDTLYVSFGGTAPTGRPIMTYYHGSEGGSVVFSGFPIWHFQRAQCAALVDFVLQDIWGLVRRSPLVASRRP